MYMYSFVYYSTLEPLFNLEENKHEVPNLVKKMLNQLKRYFFLKMLISLFYTCRYFIYIYAITTLPA